MTAVTLVDLDNAKLDVDHIAAIATSLSLTATDRLGHTKNTMAGAIANISTYNNRGAWVTATAYAVKDVVLSSGTWYVCVVAHTSSASFSTDLASKWRIYQGVTGADLEVAAGAGMIGYDVVTAYPADTVGEALNSILGAFEFRDDTPFPHVGLGTAALENPLLGIRSTMTRDGWPAGGGGNASVLDIQRTFDTNETTSASDPLIFNTRIWDTIDDSVTAAFRPWTFMSVTENFGNVANGVAVTGQIRRHGADTSMWASQFNAIDYVTGAPLAASTGGVYGTETNIAGEGDDTAERRAIGFFVAHRQVSDVHSGVVGENRHYCGILIKAASADLKLGLLLVSPGDAEIDTAIKIACKGSTVCEVFGTYANGFLIDGSATITGAHFATAGDGTNGFKASGDYSFGAFQMAADNWFILGTDTTSGSFVKMRFNDSTRKVEFKLGAINFASVSIIGADHEL